MPLSSDRPAVADPRRRSLVQAAWAAPVVIAVVGAPAAMASTSAAPTLYVFFTGVGDSGDVFLELLAGDGTPLQQQFEFQGVPRGTDAWVTAFRPSTDASGIFRARIPATLTAAYSALRIVVRVPGFAEPLISQVQRLPFEA
ncbi:hypothetical protein C5D09_14340 [Rathayibacter sp. AY1C9]|uniref:hypothetical protein n=1 Tax=unclassified Rathayibacter TaxID=2609250 RepID=UPI000CE8A34F|nr:MULTISPECIES: hypothetical protein [unclassified Rathayibacter]PPF68906.1 hypothetical protein C5C46_13970 [Rathayibacter sp. AY1E6]PPG56972.1 hypothetical protein C5C57_13450 [Rathayibacter sp. AY1C5]PPG87432.1 hypothetical protein C5C39_15540 [Rathayibacter sp. AY1F3]PPH07054.1 hypothetical protein C5C71_15365 [Rathayibacter sp. AY1C1]PPH27311.1 hypothetical protein C5C37_13870 [Rathayibacter sp. AY1F9]